MTLKSGFRPENLHLCNLSAIFSSFRKCTWRHRELRAACTWGLRVHVSCCRWKP